MANNKVTLLGSNYNPDDLKEASVCHLSNMYLEELPFPINDNSRAIATDNMVGSLQTIKVAAKRTSGSKSWLNLTGSQCRGAIVYNKTAYIVVDNYVYKVDISTDPNQQADPTVSPTYTNIKTLNTSSGMVSMAAINNYIAIADGTNSWVYKLSDTSWTNMDSQVGSNVSQVASIGAFLVFIVPNSQQFWISTAGIGTTVPGTSFASASLGNEDLVSGTSANGYLFLFSRYHTEPWYISGAVDVPLDHTSQQWFDCGIVAPFAFCKEDVNVYWLAQNENGILGLATASGSSYQIIKNRDFTRKIINYDKISDAFLWTEYCDGSKFINITFPSAELYKRGRTWQYNITTGFWNEREFFNPVGQVLPTYDRHFANFCIFLGNMQICGDFQSGYLYRLSNNYYTDEYQGVTYAISREGISPTITKNRNLFSISAIEFNLERGEGTTNDPDPQLEIYISKDGGRTFSNPVFRSMGKSGEYLKRVLVHGGGRSRAACIKWKTSTDSPFAILDATMNLGIK